MHRGVLRHEAPRNSGLASRCARGGGGGGGGGGRSEAVYLASSHEYHR